MIKEVFKGIPGYEPLYRVSNHGRVLSLGRISLRGHTIKPRFLRPGISKGLKRKTGYPLVALHKNGRQTSFFVHRLVAAVFLPNPKSLPEVDHVDGDKTNNCVSNLEWVSSLQNNRRAFASGVHDDRIKKMTKNI